LQRNDQHGLEMASEISKIELQKGEQYKYMAYKTAAKTIRDASFTITSGKEALQLKGIGKSIAQKIDEILATGTVKIIEEETKREKNSKQLAVEVLSAVPGIGIKTAESLFEKHGISSIADLMEHQDLLTHHQLVGLKYCDDLNEKIPREEIEEMVKYMQTVAATINPQLQVTPCGSFRRGLPESNDVDVIISHPEYTATKAASNFRPYRKLIDALKEKNFIVEQMADGLSKFMGVCRLPAEGQEPAESKACTD
jgi:DNA polymerase beta